MSSSRRRAILDIDGTLVDTNYHHAVAWFRAFRQHGHVVPIWRIHRHIGMGGDKLVAALLADEVEEREGDDIRAAEKALYLAFIEEVEPLRGARALIEDLQRPRPPRRAGLQREGRRGRPLPRPARRARAGRRLDDRRPTSSRPSPTPDLVLAALEKLGGGAGDHDRRLDLGLRGGQGAPGIASIAVLTGGFSEEELREAGASAVFALDRRAAHGPGRHARWGRQA